MTVKKYGFSYGRFIILSRQVSGSIRRASGPNKRNKGAKLIVLELAKVKYVLVGVAVVGLIAWMIHLYIKRKSALNKIGRMRSRIGLSAKPGGIAESQLFIIIGRGHSGTRVMSQTLRESGVFMGEPQNESSDLIPAGDLYSACRIMAKYVKYKGNLKWDFSKLHRMTIPVEFSRKLESYLRSLIYTKTPRKGWKLPETTLAFPWIVRLFPEAKYIHWMRDPRDGILSSHLTDDLSTFQVSYDQTDSQRRRRAISWKYQTEIIKATPLPKNFLTVRFEDFVLDQENTLKKLEDFLGFPLKKVPVRTDPIGRYKNDDQEHDFDFFQQDLIEFGYLPEKPAEAREAVRV